jgi:hypothetical protein
LSPELRPCDFRTSVRVAAQPYRQLLGWISHPLDCSAFRGAPKNPETAERRRGTLHAAATREGDKKETHARQYYTSPCISRYSADSHWWFTGRWPLRAEPRPIRSGDNALRNAGFCIFRTSTNVSPLSGWSHTAKRRSDLDEPHRSSHHQSHLRRWYVKARYLEIQAD